MNNYIDETIKRLEAIIRAFEKKHGEKAEVMFVLDIKRAIGVLTMLKEYKKI